MWNFINTNQATTGRKRVNNAFTPVTWFMGTVGLVMLSLIAAGAPSWLFTCAFILWALCVFSGLFAYYYFMFTDKDRLQSEDYQIHKNFMQLIQGRDLSPIDDREPLIANPNSPQTEARK